LGTHGSGPASRSPLDEVVVVEDEEDELPDVVLALVDAAVVEENEPEVVLADDEPDVVLVVPTP
jgi:hypothetical protein